MSDGYILTLAVRFTRYKKRLAKYQNLDMGKGWTGRDWEESADIFSEPCRAVKRQRDYEVVCWIIKH